MLQTVKPGPGLMKTGLISFHQSWDNSLNFDDYSAIDIWHFDYHML